MMNKIEPLRTLELNDILLKSSVTRNRYLGAYPSCLTPKTRKRVYAFILNTDEHNENGEHWCAWVVRNDTVSFFDSFGRDPSDRSFPAHFRNYITGFNRAQYTRTRIQGWDSKACGYFCIHFVYAMCLGVTFEKFLNEYSNNYLENDNVAIDFVDSII